MPPRITRPTSTFFGATLPCGVFVLSIVACSTASETTSGTAGGGPAGGPVRCVGTPSEAYTMRDSDSCRLQGADWDSSTSECRGTPFQVHCSRADESGLAVPAKKAMCLDMPGCGWTEDDATISSPSGSCSGTKTPCGALDQTACSSQPGCNFLASQGGCVPKNGFSWLDNADCAGLQIASSVSYSVVKSACERALGCAWAP